jgi:ribonucleoside-diphosphate reductase alpha chain
MKIVKIENSRNFTVDIEVENTHTYQLANGCVSHNTVSQLVDAASGIHARHGEYFIRTVRADNKDPMTKFMKEAGFPCEPDVTKPEHTTVFSFPFQSPKNAVFRQDRTAIEQLELWLAYQLYWCEHKPSITVYLNEEDWPEVGAWVWKNFNSISGISFLPNADHVYRQAPYQDCTKEEYEDFLNNKMPKDVDWSGLAEFESQDMTAGAQSFACSANGSCDIVDLVGG